MEKEGNILVVCNNPLKMFALKQIIEETYNLQVLLYSNVHEIELKIIHDNTKIEIILVDIDEFEIQEQTAILIEQNFPSSQIIVLTDHEWYYNRISGTGICGVISKKSTTNQIISMINAVKEGKTIIPISILHQFFCKNHNELLTKEEQKIMSFVIRGFTNVQIAKEIHVSTRTVEKYLNRVYEKLQVRSRVEAVEKITREKILS